MIQLVAPLLSAAVGFALSPISLIEFILVVFSRRRTVNSVTFVVALFAFAASVLLVGSQGARVAGQNDPSGPSTLVLGFFLILGLLLLVIAAKNWQNRADASEPAVLATIAGMGPGAVAILAFGATWLNPINTVLLLSTGTVIASTDVNLAGWVIGLVFLVVATLPYTLMAVYALTGGPSAETRLGGLRTWLIARNRLIAAVILAILGAILVVKALGGLL